MKISIIIPVYNEAETIEACLDAISRQVVPPHEVIVVDNNSTDDTVIRARRFTFVRVLREKQQGVANARDRGFNAATGDIIGRIDADTLIPIDWTHQLQTLFLADSQLAAVSGAVSYHDFPFSRLNARVDLLFRSSIANGMGDEVFLYGANMAIRRSAWQRVRTHVCHTAGLHEDFDLAIHLQDVGCRVKFEPVLVASVSLRRIDTGPADFWRYALLNPRTYAVHGRTSQRHMYPPLALVLSSYWLLRVAHRLYDHDRRIFSLKKLFLSTDVRVNPATYID